MNKLIELSRGTWISERRLRRVVSVIAYTGDAEAKVKPTVRVKAPGVLSTWSFADFAAAEKFAADVSAFINKLNQPTRQTGEPPEEIPENFADGHTR